MEENHMGWKLVSGVRQDLVNLFLRFANTNSVRYEDFCRVWKEMKFSLIYSNRHTFIELLEFTEELFQIVKEYILSVYEFHTRVAALYTLYGLYFKQPIREAAKIRFTKSEWEDFNSLIAKCKNEKHYDAAFVHLKMYLNGAYTFTASVRPMGLERGFRKYSEKRCNFYPNNCDVELLYRPLVSEKLVSSLVKLESLYCRKKVALLGKRNIEFIDGNFATSLQQELECYASKSKKETTKESVEPGKSDQGKEGKTEETSSKKSRHQGRKRSKTTKDNVALSMEQEQEKEKKLNLKYQELIAKKKAEFYIKKLREEYNQKQNNESASEQATKDLPQLDLS